LLHIHLSPPHEVCDRSDQAAHYHNLGPKLWASLLTRHIGWKQKKKERKCTSYSSFISDIFFTCVICHSISETALREHISAVSTRLIRYFVIVQYSDSCRKEIYGYV
jgi:hypothetical protein